MLSASAFNALLKTLEEPPAHVVFILATTELHKLPSTIVSRCQRFDFRRITTQVLTNRLAYIADCEEIQYDREALRILAKLAQGGMRDAISLLELCAGNRQTITPELVEQTVGSGGRDKIEQLVRAIAASDFDGIFCAIDEVVRSSRDVAVFWQDLISFYRDMLVMKTTATADRYLDLTEHETTLLKNACELFPRETLLYHCRELDEALYAMQRAGSAKRMIAEMALVKLCDSSLEPSMDSLLSRIAKLEHAMVSGGAFRTSTPIPIDPTEPNAPKTISERKEAQPSTATVPTPRNTEDQAISLKVLRGWQEIAEQAATGNAAVLGFLKIAKAFVASDGTVHLKFPNDFAKSMVENAHMQDSICAALCMAMQKNASELRLVMGVMDGNETLSDLDEFEL